MQETKETVGEITKYKDNIHTNRLIQLIQDNGAQRVTELNDHQAHKMRDEQSKM